MRSRVFAWLLLPLLQLVAVMVPSSRSLKEQQLPMNLEQCDFEQACNWAWNGTFQVTNAPIADKTAPKTDASKRKKGE
jgi:hypothetical protein